MTADLSANLPAVEVEAAAALRRLSKGLLSRSVDPNLSAEIAAVVSALADRVEAEADQRTKAEAFHRYGNERIDHFVRTGRWPDPPPDGSDVTFDPLSFVGGVLHPASSSVRYWRDGQEAVAHVTVGQELEGPPGRVHGGMVASIFDEVMGAAFRVTGSASAFTGSLTVRYEAGAPTTVPLEFRAGIKATEGRKYTVEATGTGPDGRFATATAIFIEMPKEMLAKALEEGGI